MVGLRQTQAAIASLHRQAQSIGNINFRATGIGRMVSEVHRLRQAAAAPIAVRFQSSGLPRLPGGGGAGGVAGGARGGGIMEGFGSVAAVGRGVVGGLAGIAAGFGGAALLKAGDAQTSQMNQLNTVLQQVGGSAQDVYEKLYALSKETGVAMQAGVQGFTQMQGAVSDMGGTSEQVLTVIEGMQKAGALAGTNTANTAETIRQMGQALGQGRLNGDELRILMERMPQLGRAMAKELGVSAGELKKLGSTGKLTNDKVFPALIRAATTFREQFGELTPTLERARGIWSVVTNRFLADLDHSIGLTEHLARGLLKITDWVDRLRSKLPVVRDFVRELGGIRSVLEVITIAAGLATAAFFRFGLSLIVPGAIVLGLTAVGVAIQDLYHWVQGRPSLMTDIFGDFHSVAERVRTELGIAAWNDLLAPLEARWQTTRQEWQALVAAFTGDNAQGVFADTMNSMRAAGEEMWRVVGPIIRGLIGGPSEMAREWPNIRAVFGDVLPAVGRFFEDLYTRVTNVVQALRSFLITLGLVRDQSALPSAPAGPPTSPEMGRAMEQMQRMRRDAQDTQRRQGGAGGGAPPLAPMTPGMLTRPELGPILNPSSFQLPDVSGRMNRAQTISASSNVTVNQSISVTATGVSAPEVAAATQSGVGRANRGAFDPAESFGRGIGINMARSEMAAT